MNRRDWGEHVFAFSIQCDEENGRMDRSSLEVPLAQGLSLAEIGRRFGRHEATVAYWMQKYGLRAVNRDQHLAKGALTREQLEPLVDAGMSIADLAKALDRSKASVSDWLAKHGLQTHGRIDGRSRAGTEAAREAGLTTATIEGPHQGRTRHNPESRC